MRKTKAHTRQPKDFNHLKQWLLPKLEQKGMSVERFANLSKLTRASVYNYLSDLSRPSEQAMLRMCRVLGVPFTEGLAQYTPKRNGRPPGIG